MTSPRLRLQASLLAVAALVVGLAGCGGSSQTHKAPASSSVCKAGNAYVWYRGYGSGKYGGPPENAAAIQPFFDTLLTEIRALRSAAPADKAALAARVEKHFAYEEKTYDRHDWGLSDAEYKQMVSSAPKDKAQEHSLVNWLRTSCSVKGKPWPTRPPLARQITSLG